MPLLHAGGTGSEHHGNKSTCPRCTQEAQGSAIMARRAHAPAAPRKHRDQPSWQEEPMPPLHAGGTGSEHRGNKSPCPRCTQKAQGLAIRARRAHAPAAHRRHRDQPSWQRRAHARAAPRKHRDQPSWQEEACSTEVSTWPAPMPPCCMPPCCMPMPLLHAGGIGVSLHGKRSPCPCCT